MSREQWSSKFGFFLASVGCAIGLGNIWMFPWRLGAYGSISFLIPYLFFTFGFVVFGLMAELAFGRATGSGTIGAFQASFSPSKRILATGLGCFQILAQTGILMFYAIALGWILHYTWVALVSGFSTFTPDQYFDQFAGHRGVLPWHATALLATGGAVFLGVQKGLERLNRLAIPLLFALLGLLLIRSLTLPGAGAGLQALVVPDWGKMVQPETWVMALGQSFFTVSLGGMLIYGSYVDKKTDLPRMAIWIVTTNFLASMLAALIILPAVMAFSLDPAKGPGLLFVTMPEIFRQMPLGHVCGLLFFTSVFLAGLSSAVNLLEIPVEAVIHLFQVKRHTATTAVLGVVWLAGIPLATNMTLFGRWADIITIYCYPAGVVLIAVVAQWVYGSPAIKAAINTGASQPIGSWVIPLLRYLFVGICVVVFLLGITYHGIG